eukprot:CAMPEP_0119125982 /NCGR_PEP_ID=MMETSP1310-20130426/5065_1 /TAXON_ID=464262 /ORGANISM="Genus nov. species nov., Strain RCC2339" /LENGTH=2428 /DNA_ID=CAMNT_0007116105 /DNA_START=408 /DNA_END=7694 /DNA_ORIENTATION=-
MLGRVHRHLATELRAHWNADRFRSLVRGVFAKWAFPEGPLRAVVDAASTWELGAVLGLLARMVSLAGGNPVLLELFQTVDERSAASLAADFSRYDLLEIAAVAVALECVTRTVLDDVAARRAFLGYATRSAAARATAKSGVAVNFGTLKLRSVALGLQEIAHLLASKESAPALSRLLQILDMNITEASAMELEQRSGGRADPVPNAVVGMGLSLMDRSRSAGQVCRAEGDVVVFNSPGPPNLFSWLFISWDLCFILGFPRYPFIMLKLLIPAVTDLAHVPDAFMNRRCIALYLSTWLDANIVGEYGETPDNRGVWRVWERVNLGHWERLRGATRLHPYYRHFFAAPRPDVGSTPGGERVTASARLQPLLHLSRAPQHSSVYQHTLTVLLADDLALPDERPVVDLVTMLDDSGLVPVCITPTDPTHRALFEVAAMDTLVDALYQNLADLGTWIGRTRRRLDEHWGKAGDTRAASGLETLTVVGDVLASALSSLARPTGSRDAFQASLRMSLSTHMAFLLRQYSDGVQDSTVLDAEAKAAALGNVGLGGSVGRAILTLVPYRRDNGLIGVQAPHLAHLRRALLSWYVAVEAGSQEPARPPHTALHILLPGLLTCDDVEFIPRFIIASLVRTTFFALAPPSSSKWDHGAARCYHEMARSVIQQYQMERARSVVHADTEQLVRHSQALFSVGRDEGAEKDYENRYGRRGLGPADVRGVASVGEALLRRHASHPDQVLFTWLADGEGEPSHVLLGGLVQSAVRVGRALGKEHGVQRGDFVALCFLPGIAFVYALVACILNGFVAVPLHPPDQGQDSYADFCGLLATGGCHVILTTQDYLAAFDAGRPDGEALNLSATWVTMDRYVTEKECCRIHDFPVTSRSDLSVVLFSSWSSEEPRGVKFSNDNLLSSILINSSVSDCSYSCLPLHSGFGLLFVLATLVCGRRSYLADPQAIARNPKIWVEGVDKYQPTLVHFPTTDLEYWVRALPDLQWADLSSVRVALLGGDFVRPAAIRAVREKFFPAKLAETSVCPAYILPECAYHVTESHRSQSIPTIRIDRQAYEKRHVVVLPGDTAEPHLELVGRGRPTLCDVAVVHPEDRTILPGMRVGEIWVRGARTTEGYLRAREGDDEVLRAQLSGEVEGRSHETWLRSGDLGFLLDGELFVTSSLKTHIHVDNVSYCSSDIENTVHQVTSPEHVVESMVTTAEVAGEERVVCIVACRHQDKLKFAFEDTCKAIIAGIQRVHSVTCGVVLLVPAESWPRSPAGKARRRRVREMFLSGTLPELYKKDNGSTEVWNSGRLLHAAIRLCPIVDRRLLIDYVFKRRLEVASGSLLPRDGPDVMLDDTGLTSGNLIELTGFLNDAIPELCLVVSEIMEAESVGRLVDLVADRTAATSRHVLPDLTSAEQTDLARFALGFGFVAYARVPYATAPVQLSDLRAVSARLCEIRGELQRWLGVGEPPSVIQSSLGVESALEELVWSWRTLWGKPAPVVEHLADAEKATKHGATSGRGTPNHPAVSSVSPRGGRSFRGGDSVAVIGVSARAPAAESADMVWKRILECSRGATPPDRLTFPTMDGFLSVAAPYIPPDVLHEYESTFASVPELRLSLVLVAEALTAANVTPRELGGSSASIFWGGPPLAPDVHPRTAAMLGFVLDTRGLSDDCDYACASALVAVSRAAGALRSGCLPVAVVASLCTAAMDVAGDLERVKVLSTAGCCRPFGADRDGTVATEFGAAVILAHGREAAAQPGWARPLAYLVGDHCGSVKYSKRGIHNVQDQAVVMVNAVRSAGMGSVNHLTAMELCGNGTKVGDELEYRALLRVLGSSPKPTTPALPVLTHSAALGHPGHSAGLLSVLKTVLTMHHRVIPPNVHDYELGNSFFSSPLVVFPTQRRELPAADLHSIACHSYAADGTLATVVFSSEPIRPARQLPAKVPAQDEISYSTRATMMPPATLEEALDLKDRFLALVEKSTTAQCHLQRKLEDDVRVAAGLPSQYFLSRSEFEAVAAGLDDLFCREVLPAPSSKRDSHQTGTLGEANWRATAPGSPRKKPVPQSNSAGPMVGTRLSSGFSLTFSPAGSRGSVLKKREKDRTRKSKLSSTSSSALQSNRTIPILPLPEDRHSDGEISQVSGSKHCTSPRENLLSPRLAVSPSRRRRSSCSKNEGRRSPRSPIPVTECQSARHSVRSPTTSFELPSPSSGKRSPITTTFCQSPRSPVRSPVNFPVRSPVQSSVSSLEVAPAPGKRRSTQVSFTGISPSLVNMSSLPYSVSTMRDNTGADRHEEMSVKQGPIQSVATELTSGGGGSEPGGSSRSLGSLPTQTLRQKRVSTKSRPGTLTAAAKPRRRSICGKASEDPPSPLLPRDGGVGRPPALLGTVFPRRKSAAAVDGGGWHGSQRRLLSPHRSKSPHFSDSDEEGSTTERNADKNESVKSLET